MSTIEQTLRKARQVDQKFKAFMQRKNQSDQSIQETLKKIQQTQKTIQSTKDTINSIDNLYDTFQKRFSQAISNALKNVQKSVTLSYADADWKPNPINEKQFVQKLKQNKQILILTGAGMGVASGIPTFRGAKGFWDKEKFDKNQQKMMNMDKMEEVMSPQEILTLRHFEKNQFSTWKWITDFYQIKSKAKLNKGHLGLHSIIQQLIGANKKVLLTTQNIDNFHTEAKQSKSQKKIDKKSTLSYEICQIHGNILKLRCDNCSQIRKELVYFPIQNYLKQMNAKQSPKCPKCNRKIRPHIMFFDEFYSQVINKSQTVQNFLKQTDLVIVIGTALQTGLSRQIVENALEKKISIIEINVECEIKKVSSNWMNGKADQIIDKIKYEIWKNGF